MSVDIKFAMKLVETLRKKDIEENNFLFEHFADKYEKQLGAWQKAYPDAVMVHYEETDTYEIQCNDQNKKVYPKTTIEEEINDEIYEISEEYRDTILPSCYTENVKQEVKIDPEFELIQSQIKNMRQFFTIARETDVNGKPICYDFKNGNCKLGDKCFYSHLTTI